MEKMPNLNQKQEFRQYSDTEIEKENLKLASLQERMGGSALSGEVSKPRHIELREKREHSEEVAELVYGTRLHDGHNNFKGEYVDPFGEDGLDIADLVAIHQSEVAVKKRTPSRKEIKETKKKFTDVLEKYENDSDMHFVHSTSRPAGVYEENGRMVEYGNDSKRGKRADWIRLLVPSLESIKDYKTETGMW